MSKESPPWTCPAAERVEVGGSNPCGAVGKPWETMGRKATGLRRWGRKTTPCTMFAGLHMGKPLETAGRKAAGLRPRESASGLCQPGCSHSKLPETAGRKARGLNRWTPALGAAATCQPSRRILCIRFCKETKIL